MTRASLSASSPERPGFGVRSVGWFPTTTASSIATSFLISFGLAAIVLAIFGVGNRGTVLALRVTARWSFLLFWFAYAGGAMAMLFGPRLAALGRRGRDLGLGFASAQLIHVGLVLWIIHITAGPSGAMLFFWVGILCTYLLAFFSLPWVREAAGPRLWRIFLTISLEYIALAFAVDFIFDPLQAGDFGGYYPLTYLPFALLLIAGAGLRIAAFSDRKLLRERLSFSVHATPEAPQFGRVSREQHRIEQKNQPVQRVQEVTPEQRKDRLIVWPLQIFIGVIVIALAVDHAYPVVFWTALGLYGPATVVFLAYVLLGRRFVGSGSSEVNSNSPRSTPRQ